MANVITLSGWGQAHNSLAAVVPKNALHLDYSKFPSVSDFFDSLRKEDADVLVGWSLGGQLALRAISENILKPKVLILISAPYQFVANKDIKCSMNKDTFNSFCSSFQNDPVKTLKRFLALISLNDIYHNEVLKELRNITDMENASRWLYWLRQLESFSCNSLDFSKIPSTIAVHGLNDTIVDSTQTGLFKSLIKDYKIEIFEECGHAPHLHNQKRVKEIVQAVL